MNVLGKIISVTRWRQWHKGIIDMKIGQGTLHFRNCKVVNGLILEKTTYELTSVWEHDVKKHFTRLVAGRCIRSRTPSAIQIILQSSPFIVLRRHLSLGQHLTHTAIDILLNVIHCSQSLISTDSVNNARDCLSHLEINI